ncbi:uncharacterized protein LOC132046244 [Lycium ferocissimum]|uniref:uncharacterized protein LOC132046244 n=1 Tax=Lycium ferocissimum TaxID=112874 RepID=UPI00281553AA|nr:uncharacterized protein LOC132046244 [Lycium ferocissimum]
MAGADYITIDAIEGRQAPLRALRSNVMKLLEVEQRSDAINKQKFDLELQAGKVISELDKNILFLMLFIGGMSMYLTTKIPSATAFAISVLLMCLFVVVSFMHISMAKSRITSMNVIIKILTERYKEVRVDARILMELEESRKRRLAANVVDNSEDPIVDMDFFIARTKTICDATDSSDFEKVYHKIIYMSWGIGGIYIPLVLVMSYFNYYYGEYFLFYDFFFSHNVQKEVSSSY